MSNDFGVYEKNAKFSWYWIPLFFYPIPKNSAMHIFLESKQVRVTGYEFAENGI